jgi:hypothetical protein
VHTRFVRNLLIGLSLHAALEATAGLFSAPTCEWIALGGRMTGITPHLPVSMPFQFVISAASPLPPSAPSAP